MRSIIIVFLFLLIFPMPSKALDLDAINLYANVIKSLQQQEKGWFINGDDLVFAKPSDVKDLQKKLYPEHDIRSIIVMSYNLFYDNKGYVRIDKPLSEYLRGQKEEKILEEIKILVMEKLYKEGIRRREGIKKQKSIDKAPEPKPVKSGELVKFEAEGRKL